MISIRNFIDYLKKNELRLTTAESCTAGQIAALLGRINGCGECLDIAYVVYSESAKRRTLGVRKKTIKKYSLTSENVALEMAVGALKKSDANVVIATTGIIGDKAMDGIPPGTVCFACGIKKEKQWLLHAETIQFEGTRAKVQKKAAYYALNMLTLFLKNQ